MYLSITPLIQILSLVIFLAVKAKQFQATFFWQRCQENIFFPSPAPHRYHLGALGSRTDEAIFWSCLAPPPRSLWGPQRNELRRDVKPLWPQPGVFRRWPNRAEKYWKPGHRSVGWAKGRELVCERLTLVLCSLGRQMLNIIFRGRKQTLRTTSGSAVQVNTTQQSLVWCQN